MTEMPIQSRDGTAYIDLNTVEAGPKRVTSLLSRHVPLGSPTVQLEQLHSLDLSSGAMAAEFEIDLRESGWADGLQPATLEIFQINLGKLCNMTCRHCHVDAGPDRVEENMSLETVEACLRAIDISGAHTVDLTGGAPELNPHFRYLVDQCVLRGLHVIDRCNLTVLLLPRCRGLAEWFADRGVEVVCSLPHYRKLNTDAQRGAGAYQRSIKALQLLNGVGYGKGDSRRQLTLMHNPAGAFLPAAQPSLESEWKSALSANHGITFDRLLTLNNMPISRFLEWLVEKGCEHTYMQKLVSAFNPAAVAGLMCRNTISVSWDGRLFDCDFNQMLDLEVSLEGVAHSSVQDFDLNALGQRRVVTDRHCYGCTAGAGSSCSGATT